MKDIKYFHTAQDVEQVLHLMKLHKDIKKLKHNTVIAKFKRKGTENEYFLAWTTTPWTLPSNVALTVNPEVDYLKVKQR